MGSHQQQKILGFLTKGAAAPKSQGQGGLQRNI
jgi:hypothetical protein